MGNFTCNQKALHNCVKTCNMYIVSLDELKVRAANLSVRVDPMVFAHRGKCHSFSDGIKRREEEEEQLVKQVKRRARAQHCVEERVCVCFE